MYYIRTSNFGAEDERCYVFAFELDVVALNWVADVRKQYGIYFLPTSRQYNVVLPSQNRNLFIVKYSKQLFTIKN